MHLGVNLFGNKGFVDFPENLRKIQGIPHELFDFARWVIVT